MPVDLLDSILEAARVGETTDWEFKSARGGFPGSFWETYSAMANSEGGVIILGAREKDGVVHLDGLTPEQAANHQKNLWDNVHNRNTVSANLLTMQDVTIVELDGPVLLAIHVPRATRTQRPVYLGHNPLGHTYRRHHEGDYRCTDAEVRRMLADADETPPDHRVLQGFGIDDLDRSSLFQFYIRVWPKIAAGLPTPFRLEHGERRDVTPAHEALREAFVNSLIHGDYSGVGGVPAERWWCHCAFTV